MNRTVQLAQVPPGTFGLPLIRENLGFIRDPDKYTLRKSKQYGDIYKTHILGNPTIIIKGKKIINYVLENENIYFTNDFPYSLKVLIGNSLGTQFGDLHQERRKVLSRIFQFKKLKNYQNRLEEITSRYLEEWSKAGKVDLYKNINKYSFDIAGEYLLGIKNISNTSLFQDYNIWSKGMFSIPIKTPFTSFGKAFKAKERISEYIRNNIESKKHDSDTIPSLLSSINISNEEIVDQILMMLYAGHGTISSAIWTLCYQLELNPQVYDEYKNIANNNSIESFNSYTEAIVRECLRIAPPVGGGFRKVIKENSFCGYTFPEGWSVIYQIRETELDSKTYQNPFQFDPERQLDTKDIKILAFGGGARECIGRELAKQEIMCFSKVYIRNYKFKFINKNKIQLTTIPTVQPKNKVLVEVNKL